MHKIIYLNIIKAVCDKVTANIIFSGEKTGILSSPNLGGGAIYICWMHRQPLAPSLYKRLPALDISSAVAEKPCSRSRWNLMPCLRKVWQMGLCQGGAHSLQSACQCRRCKGHECDPRVGKSPDKDRQPTPVFLPGEVHGQRSQAGCSPWGQK